MTTETRARRRIRQAVESRGRELAFLDWSPWQAAAEKEGIGGGWYGQLEPLNDDPLDAINQVDVMGLSVEEAIAWIDVLIDPPEPCECAARHSPLFPLRGDPQTGRHEPGCRWHLRYRWPWWD
jgi:hypothetical protein